MEKTKLLTDRSLNFGLKTEHKHTHTDSYADNSHDYEMVTNHQHQNPPLICDDMWHYAFGRHFQKRLFRLKNENNILEFHE
jgi:hypothetical protein